jgi:hypothetical protein
MLSHMENDQLQEFVQRIWDSTPRDMAVVRFGGYNDSLELIGNRAGLLRLAAELLSAATYAGTNPAYLFKSQARGPVSGITKIVVDETAPEPLPKETRWTRFRKKLGAFGCLVVLVFTAICAIVGLYSILKAL